MVYFACTSLKIRHIEKCFKSWRVFCFQFDEPFVYENLKFSLSFMQKSGYVLHRYASTSDVDTPTSNFVEIY
jgi:hypothetical protein